MKKIIINPLGDILYQSFYVQALYETFGRKNVSFGNAPFRSLSVNAMENKGILFVVKDAAGEKKIVIDGGDFNTINEEIYKWCDVYGSVNANFSKTSGKEKLVSLCPSFAVKCWNTFDTMCFAIINVFRYINGTEFKGGLKSVKHFLGRHRRLVLRAGMADMVPGKSEDNYIFFCSTLWYNHESNKNDERVNLRRAWFVRTCKSMKNVCFEGGFVKQPGRSTELLFDDCLSSKSYSHIDWVRKTQKSSIVFNTPAFWDCHGWKLGEYLAMGKAIISTPLVNDLPYPLEHGVNIHYVESNPESIQEGISYVLSHPEYRHSLEQGAIEYWRKWGNPISTMKLLNLI